MTEGRAVFAGIVIAGLYYMLLFDGGDAYKKQIVTHNQAIKKNEKLIVELKKTVEVVKRYEKKKKELGDRFNEIVKYIPEKYSVVDQMKIISAQAKSAGISINKISEGGKGRRFNFYEEVPVSVDLSGSYSQLILFLSYLTKIDKILVLKNMKMTSSGVSKKGDFNDVPKISFAGNFIGYRTVSDDKAKGRRR